MTNPRGRDPLPPPSPGTPGSGSRTNPGADLAPPTSTSRPGETVFVGRYQLVERLAVGGMAEVFLGVKRMASASEVLPKRWQPGKDTLVVLKRILPHLAEKPEFVEAFVREARITSGIRHENVVQILELGESGGLPFIAMEFVAGSTLKQLVVAARHFDVRIAPDIAVNLLVQCAAGLHAAHELADITGKPYGLVHRDISPHNLMVDEKGVVKLLDFGIAKANEGMDHTRTGMLKGKISYMSPEQCRQERLDRRSDLFSLGVVAFELLTRQRPFQAASELATMQAIVAGNRSAIRELAPEVSLELAAVVDKALQPLPDDRWPTASAFADALAAACPPADLERTALFVRTVLGERHDQRRKLVGEALERTLVSLSDQAPAPLPPAGPSASGQSSLELYVTPEPRPPEPHAPEPPLPPRVPKPGVGPGVADTAPVAAPRSPEAVPPRRTGVWVAVGAGLLLLVLAGLGLAALAVGARLWAMPRGEPVVVRMAPVIAAADLERDHAGLRRYLESRLGRPVEFRIAPSYESAADTLLDRRDAAEGDDGIEFAFLPAGTVRFVAGQDPGVQVLAVKVVDGSAETDGYLLVRREEGAPAEVSDLKGRTICLADPLSSTGWKMPRAFLQAKGFDLDHDVTILASGSHEAVLQDLLASRCDAGATYSGNFQSADQRGIETARLRILATTGTSPHDAFVASSDADPALTAALREALLSFDPKRDLGVPRAGESERITGFSAPSERYLNPPAPGAAPPEPPAPPRRKDGK